MVFMDRAPGSRLPRPLLVFVLITLLVGAAGSVLTTPSIPTWYASLAKPSFNPPNWVFAPVWTTLYVLMGVAAWRVWETRHRPASPLARSAPMGEVASTGDGSAATERKLKPEGVRLEMAAFAIQLAFNLAWSWVFFTLHRIGAALGEIAVLWLLVLATTILFWRRDRIAGLLLLPYLAWTGFAAALTHAIWRLNG